MARIKAHTKTSAKRGRTSISPPRTRRSLKLNDTDNTSDVARSVSPQRESTPIAKPAPRRKSSSQVIVTSPPPASEASSTAQLGPAPKRKGGNKRKWTHEYCLTCTRYGRACGGRREGEEGCAVCRNPDKAKGEKLRECLWADANAGIFDYKTAREVLKRAQAAARASRAKPSVRRKQHSQAALPNSLLPETSRPLDLLPPARPQPNLHLPRPSMEHEDGYDTITVDRPYIGNDRRVDGFPEEEMPRIHRPKLTYLNMCSDDEDQTFAAPRIDHPVVHTHQIVPYPPHRRDSQPLTYDELARLHGKPQPNKSARGASAYHNMDPYRSPYDTVPHDPHPVNHGKHESQAKVPAVTGPSTAPPTSRTHLGSVNPAISSPRRWSVEHSKVPSIGGHMSKVKSWRSIDTAGDRNDQAQPDGNEHKKTVNGSLSDTSSLSSYMSVQEDLGNNRTHDSERQDNRTTNGSRRDLFQRPMKSTQSLRLNFATANQTEKSRRQRHPSTIPGEIIIQEDEEMGTSESDSELTSDEGKLKSLPPKLRKILSRNRITKVMIGDMVFEVRPKAKNTPVKAHKNHSSLLEGTHVASKAQRHKGRDGGPLLTHDENEAADREVSHGVDSSKPTPLKIKLIIGRKTAENSPQTLKAGKLAGSSSHQTSDTADDIDMADN